MAKVQSEISARSYIATEAFNNDFFTYKVTKVNFNTVGSLPLVTADASLCPAGRVLRENGRKLAPLMNPGVPTYMVGVYDNQSGLSGFIDPNAPVFAIYNNHRPNFLVDNVDLPPGGLTDHGQPVLTNGLVSALQSVSAGTTVTAGTSVSAGTSVTAATGNITATVGNIVAPVGKLVVGSFTGDDAVATFAAGSAAVGVVTMTGAVRDLNSSYSRVTVNTTACKSTSKIFLTYGSLNRPGILSAEVIQNNSFVIVSTGDGSKFGGGANDFNQDTGKVQFLVIN